MSFDRETLLQRLAELEDVAGRPRRYVVAFSGGLDSGVLTHALSTSSASHGLPVVAVHIDHGLQPGSADWEKHCAAFASALGIEYRACRVDVDTDSGQGPEAAARDARYAALGRLLEPGDWLLSAHHEDDQAETVLLNLMRGSGTSGMAGIPDARRFADGWLVRPLLDVPRLDLEAYADRHGLVIVEDPSNLDQQYDRNYLRHEIMPRLGSRWPEAAGRIRHAAQLAREASTLLTELAEIDRAGLSDRSDRLSISELARLPVARQRNLLRYVILEHGLPMPGAAQLEQIVRELVPARDDAQPLVAWPGGRARRYRDRLYLLAGDEIAKSMPARRAVEGERVSLPGALGWLVLKKEAPRGLSAEIVQRGLELRFRVGGEKFTPENHKHKKKLKKLLQEDGVVPWMREQLPLIYSGDELVAVADLWIAAGAVAEPGTAIEWRNRPPIH